MINPYGTPARVVEAVTNDRVVAVVTQHLLDELAAVLTRPKFRRWLTLAEAVAFVEALSGKADLQPDSGPPPQRVRDPDDDYLVALAHAAGAVILTGDADHRAAQRKLGLVNGFTSIQIDPLDSAEVVRVSGRGFP